MEKLKQLQKALIDIIQNTHTSSSSSKKTEDQASLESLEKIVNQHVSDQKTLLSYFFHILTDLGAPLDIPQKGLVDFFSCIQRLFFEIGEDSQIEIQYQSKVYCLQGLCNACSLIESEIERSILNPFKIKKDTSHSEIEALVDEILQPYIIQALEKGRVMTPAPIPHTPPPSPHHNIDVIEKEPIHTTHITRTTPRQSMDGIHPYAFDGGMLLWSIFRNIFPVPNEEEEIEEYEKQRKID